MAAHTRRVFMVSSGLGAGWLLGGSLASAARARPPTGDAEALGRAPLDDLEVSCGFKERQVRHRPHRDYGRALRASLLDDARRSIEEARPQGHRAQLEAVASVLERHASAADATRLRELWVSVEGRVAGKYRTRHYVAEI